VVREVVGRYRGSLLGVLWSLANPILMLGVYAFVFGIVFRARWGADDTSGSGFAVLIFSGMIIHALFSECFIKAPGLVVGNVNYVKKVVFPLEILPWVSLGAALFHACVSLLVLLAFTIAVYHQISWTVLLFPIVIGPFLLVIMGISWWLAATGVYVRDISQLTGMLSTVLLFLSPVFYPLSALPDGYQWILLLNPLTFVIVQFREVLVFGRLPDWLGLGIYSTVGLVVVWAGFAWFQKTRRGFADVI
jgi:lipopolysaccharide transport system permease protein